MSPIFLEMILPSDFIKQAALQAGFDACGIARAEFLEDDAVFLKQWLAENRHGNMSYLERNFEKRTDPRQLVPGCQSVVVLLLNYYPEREQSIAQPRIAKYAYSAVDYHTVVKEKLRILENSIVENFGADAVSQQLQHSFVDSAPVLERRWAQKAGLGWIGKHTQLISPGWGSFCFIGILLLNYETQYDEPIKPRCGGCTKCMDACPTKAIHNGTIDARRCISYLTIENKEPIAEEFQPQLQGCALGCDICADACPWNKKWAHAHQHPELKPYENADGIRFSDWESPQWDALNEAEFKEVFRYSAVKRAGFAKLSQNLQVVRDSVGKND